MIFHFKQGGFRKFYLDPAIIKAAGVSSSDDKTHAASSNLSPLLGCGILRSGLTVADRSVDGGHVSAGIVVDATENHRYIAGGIVVHASDHGGSDAAGRVVSSTTSTRFAAVATIVVSAQQAAERAVGVTTTDDQVMRATAIRRRPLMIETIHQIRILVVSDEDVTGAVLDLRRAGAVDDLEVVTTQHSFAEFDRHERERLVPAAAAVALIHVTRPRNDVEAAARFHAELHADGDIGHRRDRQRAKGQGGCEQSKKSFHVLVLHSSASA
jgi:hypothetical protein